MEEDRCCRFLDSVVHSPCNDLVVELRAGWRVRRETQEWTRRRKQEVEQVAASDADAFEPHALLMACRQMSSKCHNWQPQQQMMQAQLNML